MNRNVLLVLFVALLILLSNFSVSAQVSPSLRVTVLQYTPFPAEPGKNVEIWIQAQNQGTKDIQNLITKLSPKYPFSLAPGDDGIRKIGALSGSNLPSGGQRAFTTYTLKIDPSAYEEKYVLDLLYSDGGEVWDKTTFDIQVIGYPRIVISKTNITPKSAEPGKEVQVLLSLSNEGTGIANNVAFTLDITPAGSVGITPTGGTGARPPFALIGAGTEFYLGSLRPNEVRVVDFKLAVDPAAEKGVYSLPVTITYSGFNTSARNAQETYLGISVISKASLSVQKVETDPGQVIPGTSFLLSTTVENNGNADAKSVRVVVLPNEQLRGKTTSYLGTIKAGDKDVALLELSLLQTDKKEIPVVFNISYADDLGLHSFIEKNKIVVSQAAERTAGRQVSRGYLTPINMAYGAVAVILVVGFYWFFIRRKKIIKKER